MPTLHLNNSYREKIIQNALEEAFGKTKAKLALTEDKLGRRCYEKLFTPEVRGQAIAMPKNWLRYETSLRFNIDGYTMSFQVSEPIPVPSNSYMLGVVRDLRIKEAALKLMEDKSELKQSRESLRTKLTAQLSRIRTLKQLKATWPEGQKLYQFLLNLEPAQLPTVSFSEVNAVLRLKAAA